MVKVLTLLVKVSFVSSFLKFFDLYSERKLNQQIRWLSRYFQHLGGECITINGNYLNNNSQDNAINAISVSNSFLTHPPQYSLHFWKITQCVTFQLSRRLINYEWFFGFTEKVSYNKFVSVGSLKRPVANLNTYRWLCRLGCRWGRATDLRPYLMVWQHPELRPCLRTRQKRNVKLRSYIETNDGSKANMVRACFHAEIWNIQPSDTTSMFGYITLQHSTVTN